MSGGSFEARLEGLATLAEPVRRRLYHYVVTRAEPVSREVAAEGVGVPLHVAKFHLDRLVAAGLLAIEYRRPPGRGGPGGGRPTKLYSRSAATIEVTVPERRYELAARLLAGALDGSELRGVGAADVVGEVARQAGRRLGAAAQGDPSATAEPLVAARRLLDEQGYETGTGPDGALVLLNCPFASLAGDYTELVCGMNLEFIAGLLAGLGMPGLTAHLDPGPHRCCVTVRPS